MTEIIRGRLLAKNILEKTKARLPAPPPGRTTPANPPGLGVILIGADPASTLYVKLKTQAAKEVGLYVEIVNFDKSVDQKLVLSKIAEWNHRTDINGILVQFPVPKEFDGDLLVKAIHPNKDVDGFHPENRAALLNGKANLVPPVALAIMRLIQATHLPLTNKHALIISKSTVFAEPLIELMKEAGLVGSRISPRSATLKPQAQSADLIVVAVGKAGFLTKELVKPGAIIIDVGTNRENGKVVGDTAPDAAALAAFISPVPGGVGPLTVAYLVLNVIRAQEKQTN
ncbi:MAG: bifunctional 5,10-methylenetetrahydrofolate dehydrogenase/5,10-methenyltetrahydrofolate cyclohydrolase [Patescibacteria group bacterium]